MIVVTFDIIEYAAVERRRVTSRDSTGNFGCRICNRRTLFFANETVMLMSSNYLNVLTLPSGVVLHHCGTQVTYRCEWCGEEGPLMAWSQRYAPRNCPRCRQSGSLQRIERPATVDAHG